MGFLKMIGLVTAEEHARVVIDRDEARSDLSICKRDLEIANAAVAGSADLIEKLRAEVAALRPDAELLRNKRKRDREQKAAKAKAAPKVGKATGKPRTAIPAKVGKSTSAKISGDRPATKGRK
jgi:hypothetical protein